MPIRPAAVAGTWYPGAAPALAAAVDRHLAEADAHSHLTGGIDGTLVALIAPHAGLMYSGPVAAHAYRLLRGRPLDLIVLVGPSHFVGFDGMALYPSGGFQTPLGVARIDEACASSLMDASPVIRAWPAAHAREHSLEMQLPFLQRVAPEVPIVPMVMGHQTPATVSALARALADVLEGTTHTRHVLLIASTDLSHFHDAATAARLDGVVLDCVSRLDDDGLQRALTAVPEHACGGGPTVAVMRAAKALGAAGAVVLSRADSGDVSGDKTSVVGYVAAALGTFG